MSLIFKPHSVTVEALVEDTDSATGEVAVVEPGSASSAIACKIESVSSDTLFKALGIDTKEGYRLMCELADMASFPLNARVHWSAGSMVLRVAAPPRAFRSAIGLTDHATMMLIKEDPT